MYSQLLASLTKTEGMAALLACADAVNGVVGKLHSFNIMLRSTVAAVDVNGALVAEAAATDCAAALAWHEQSVCRALGEVKMYSNEDDPTYYGDIYSFWCAPAAAVCATMGRSARDRTGHRRVITMAKLKYLVLHCTATPEAVRSPRMTSAGGTQPRWRRAVGAGGRSDIPI